MTPLNKGGEIVNRRLLPAAEHVADRTAADLADSLLGRTLVPWTKTALLAGWEQTPHKQDSAVGLLAIQGLAMLPVIVIDDLSAADGVRTKLQRVDGQILGQVTQRKSVPGWWAQSAVVTSQKFVGGWAHTASESGRLMLPMCHGLRSPSWWKHMITSTDFASVGRDVAPGPDLDGAQKIIATVTRRKLLDQDVAVAVWDRIVTVSGPSIVRHAQWAGLSGVGGSDVHPYLAS
ncbi:hypothetical protein [Gordonia sihwensis]|uniref:hypothetical protein n=1 Tax=Gordonia sihwensis TaxID=173559 RepID=UPI0012E02224|nr:hypothetical protein [Gordonia sihwensis]